MFRASNRDSDNAIVFRTIELLMKTADRCLIWPKLLFGKFFEKNLLLKIGQNQPKRKEKIFELFLNFFFQTMICSQNVLQTQGFQTLTSDFQYRTYSWRFFNFWKFYLFFIILNLKCVEYSIVCRDVRSTDIQKPKLGPERYDNLGHFPYKTR